MSQDDPFDKKNYSIRTLRDEIKADNLCKILLKHFHKYLLENKGFSQLKAGTLAGGTDFFLRDFMIDNCRTNIFSISPQLVSGFAGNWYIVNTLEPNMVELENIMNGVRYFYDYCVETQVIDRNMAEKITQACSRFDYYQQRIDDFNNLSGDGFSAWNSACQQQ